MDENHAEARRSQEEGPKTVRFTISDTDAFIARLEENKGFSPTFGLISLEAWEQIKRGCEEAEAKDTSARPKPDHAVFEFKFEPAETTLKFGKTPEESKTAPTIAVDASNVTLTWRAPTVFWANGDGLGCVVGALSLWMGMGKSSDAGEEWKRVADALNARNRRLGFESPFPEESSGSPTLSFDFRYQKPAQKKQRQSTRAKPLPSQILNPSNNVHRAAIHAFSATENWCKDPLDGFAYGLKQEHKHLEITVGLPDGTQADSLWAFLSKAGPPMVKAHYALWGRWYEDGGQIGGEPVIVNIAQFCADLGYTRHHKGGYRREHKQDAVRILEAITAVEMRATFTPPDKGGKQQRLRGPLWTRGIIAEENDQFGDLFGAAREGRHEDWEPIAFSYAPGPFFANTEWRKYNQAVGKIGAGLLRLDNRNDEWALLIGGYLGTLLRMNHYAPLRLRAGTILEKANLAQGKDAERRVTQYREKFERALDRLQEVCVIQSWTWPDVDTQELSDPDDPDAVASYYDADLLPKGDWRRQIVQINVAMEAETQRLKAAQDKAIKAAGARKTRRQQETKKKNSVVGDTA